MTGDVDGIGSTNREHPIKGCRPGRHIGIGVDCGVGGLLHKVTGEHHDPSVITGGTGFDDINGNMGNDTVVLGSGDSWAVGGRDNDLLFGDAGQDFVYGNLGDDTMAPAGELKRA